MEVFMRNRYLPILTVSALALLAAGCGTYQSPPPNPPPGYTAIPPQAPDERTIYIAPNAPPPPLAETIPPAPGPTVYWQPGHWGWTGSKWTWLAGHYENRPSQQMGMWVPGQWQQSSNGYVWVDGHWQ
jgi:hypothetical protein